MEGPDPIPIPNAPVARVPAVGPGPRDRRERTEPDRKRRRRPARPSREERPAEERAGDSAPAPDGRGRRIDLRA